MNKQDTKKKMIDEILQIQREELENNKNLEAIYVSALNHHKRHTLLNNKETGVDIRKGDICYIDFGKAFIGEIGYQHFGIIIAIYHNKAFVVPMSGNKKAFKEAYSSENPFGKKHLMQFEKIGKMNKNSVLFINDAKWISTARIIDVKAHLNINSDKFKEIIDRVKNII